MGKTFNITADCKPDLHYMVDLSSRLKEIKGYVDQGKYYTMNRARQYGKTTTLRALEAYLAGEYYVIGMDFQVQMSHAKFRSENAFSLAFAKAFVRILQNLNEKLGNEMEMAVECLRKAVRENDDTLELVELFQGLSDICAAADKPLVLLIDEVDSAANNQVFLDFLAQLRGYYIDRDRTAIFQSVILAGVYDIKNLRRKYRPQEGHKMNSPWNIAMDFKLDMSFSTKEIAGMLEEYEMEHATGMDVEEMAKLIYEYTSGYPFLVSKLCKLMDEEIGGSETFPEKKMAWTYAGFWEAEKLLLGEKNTLFESMVNKLYDFPELKETVFYNWFLTSAENQNTEIYKAAIQDKNQFVHAGHLNMDLLLEKFVTHFNDLYEECD